MNTSIEKEARERPPARQLIKRAAREASFPLFAAVLSFAVSATSPALGATPIGPALVCAAPSLCSALPVLAGALFSALRLGRGGGAFSIVLSALFVARFALGSLGAAKTKTVGARFFAPFCGPARRDDAIFIKLNSSFNSSFGVRCALALSGALAIGLANVFSGINVWYDLFGTVLSSTLSPVFCLGISALCDPDANVTLRKAGAGVLLYSIILSISGVTMGGFSLALVAALGASLAAGRTFGAADGALFGAFAGLALDPGVFGIMPIAAMCSGALSAYSLGAATVSSAVLGMSWSLFANGISAVSSTLPEVTVAAALFYPGAKFGLIPGSADLSKSEVRRAERASGRGVGMRLRELAEAMAGASKIIFRLSSRLSKPGGEELTSICEGEISSKCAACAKREYCRPSPERAVSAEASHAASVLSAKGQICASDLFPETVRRCPHTDEIVDGINRAYRAIIDGSLDGKCEAIGRDYAVFSDMILGCIERADAEHERNKEKSERLERALTADGIGFESASVYGCARPEIFVRGMSVKDLSCGSEDLRRIAEDALGATFAEPEMSLDCDSMDMYLAPRRAFCPKCGSYSAPGNPDEANGDAALSFSSGDGTFFAAICDGMGSGSDAALTSRSSALFLRRMLSAGCGEREALKLLGDFTRARRLECFSTVDLLRIDPFSGDALFVKSGAAPSFVRRAGQLFKIECETPPVGIIENPCAKTVKFRLEEGDVVVLVSDGVLPDEEASSWLYEYLASGKNLRGDPPAVAKRIAEASASRAARRDDTTVEVIRIEKAA